MLILPSYCDFCFLVAAAVITATAVGESAVAPV